MLKGKTALVTGSTSGIGLGIARALAMQGCSLMLNGFGDKNEIAELQKSLTREFSVQVDYHPADVGKPEDMQAIVTQAEKNLGSLDILVNNAGIQFTSPVESFPVEKWQAIISINLSGAFYGIRAALPGMQKRGWGRIINIASAHGLVASKEKSAYVAAKHGIVGLTKVVALENATKGITCNAICPGWVLTPLVQKQIDDRAAKEGISKEKAEKDLLGEKQPSLQFSTTEQIGELAVFLSSDAAKNITGAAYTIDGGWTAQ